MKLRVFTDGACSENPGAGGWAAVFNLKNGYKVISGHEASTTNNRMELMAVIKALQKAISKGILNDVEVHSDSAYVVNAVTKGWFVRWKVNGWKTTSGEDVKNRDLWEELDKLMKQMHGFELVKVKGHSGNTFNEIADKAAREEVLKAKAEK